MTARPQDVEASNHILYVTGMIEAVRKDKRWRAAVANARAIRGALIECLKLADQLSDVELKVQAMHFVNALEHHVALFLGEERRVRPRQLPEKELMTRLRDEVAHIRQLMEDNERVVRELHQRNATALVLDGASNVNRFAATIERKFVY